VRRSIAPEGAPPPFSLPKRALDSERLLDTTQRVLARAKGGRTDWANPVIMLLLSVIGVFFIYSSQVYVGGTFWQKQLVWIAMGGVLYVVVGRLDYRLLMEHAALLYLGALVLLLMLFLSSHGVPLLGVAREGAWRWLNFGIMNYQPSEAAKIGILVIVASVLTRSELGSIRDSLWVLVKVFILTAIPLFLIFLQPDLGTCLILPPMVLAMLYVSKLSLRFFLIVFGLAAFAVGMVAVDMTRYTAFLEATDQTALEARGEYEETSFFPLKDYQRERIMSFVAPQVVDPRGTGSAWNANQAQLAVGTGGLTGKGWTNSLQALLGYLPRSVAHNDFIFAVVAEERGFVGGVAVVLLFVLLLGNNIRIAGLSRDRFGTLLCVGVSVILLIHFFINVGMTIGVTPITGLPLPFLSYGGSFLLSCCFLLGIVQSVHRHRRET